MHNITKNEEKLGYPLASWLALGAYIWMPLKRICNMIECQCELKINAHMCFRVREHVEFGFGVLFIISKHKKMDLGF